MIHGPATTAPNQANPPRMNLMLIPPPPRKPSRRAQELIFQYQGAQKVLLLSGVFFLGIGLVLTTVLGWGLPVDLLLDLGIGRVVQTAQVVDRKIDTHIEINGENPMRIVYRYSVGGASYQGSGSTRNQELIGSAVPGTAISVQRSTWNAGWSRLPGESYSFFGYWGLLMALFPVGGAAMVYFAVRAKRRAARVYVNGRAVMAKVVFKGQDTTYELNGRYPFKIAWEFRVDGEIYSGSISSMSLLRVEDLMAQDEVPVLYDPQDPGCNAVYLS